MKFTIKTKEFKNVMQLVKTVADCSANAQVTAHNICLLRAFPSQKTLVLEFSLGLASGSFLTYTFEDIKMDGVEGVDDEVKRSIDLQTLAALKFSGETVSIVLGKNRDGNTLEFSSGKLKGKLLLSHQDIERIVEETRPTDDIELTQTFMISDFLSALSAHTYGAHHNAVSASKRVVRIYNKQVEGDEGKLIFASKDNVVGALFSKPMTSPYKEPFEYYVFVKPFRAILNSLSQDISNVFHFGITTRTWRIAHGNINVWFPNIVQATKAELEDVADKTEAASALTLKTSSESLQEALSEISPFTSGVTLAAKDDNPIVRFLIEGDVARFTMDTAKAKDVVVDIDDVEFFNNGLPYDKNDYLMINSKYLGECVTSLAANDTTKLKDREPKPLTLLWWPSSPDYPMKGKMICLKQGGNYYWICRIVEKVKTL